MLARTSTFSPLERAYLTTNRDAAVPTHASNTYPRAYQPSLIEMPCSCGDGHGSTPPLSSAHQCHGCAMVVSGCVVSPYKFHVFLRRNIGERWWDIIFCSRRQQNSNIHQFAIDITLRPLREQSAARCWS